MAVQGRKFTDAMAPAMALAINSSRNGDPIVLVNYGVATLAAGVATVSSGLLGNIAALTADCLVMHARAKNSGTLGFIHADPAQFTSPVGTLPGVFVLVSANTSDTSSVFWQLFQPAIHQDTTSSRSGDFSNPSTANLASSIGTAASTLASATAVAGQLDAVFRAHLADSVAHLKADTTNVPSPAFSTVVDQTTLDTYLNALQTSFNAHLTQSGVHVVNDTVNSNSTAAATNLSTSITLVNALAASLLAHIGRAIPGNALSLSRA